MKSYCLKFLFLIFFCALLFGVRFPVIAQQTFVMGEDVVHPSGLVIAVNSIERYPFTSGLGVQEKKDEVFISLTFVNTGIKTCIIDPVADFSLELSTIFHPRKDSDGRATQTVFNIFPNSQTRFDLYFRVLSSQENAPVLLFSHNDFIVRILCDSGLYESIQKGNTTALSPEEAVKLGRSLVETGRYSQAQEIILSALQLEPGNNQLLLLMSYIEDENDNYDGAVHYLGMINPSSVSNSEDAVDVAAMAMSMGFYRKAIDFLEPQETIHSLKTGDRVMLARAYYYENDFVSASGILEPMITSDTNESGAYFVYANMLERQDKIEEAVNYWEKTVSLSPNHIEANFNLGVGCYKLGDFVKARECWQKILTLDTDSDTMRATRDALDALDNN